MSDGISTIKTAAVDPVEEWRPIPGYVGYQVSNYGMVYSDKRGKFMVSRPSKAGYMEIELSSGPWSDRRIRVHRLVMIAFVGPIPEGMFVNHKNGVKYDNRVSNLEYVTKSENSRHAYQTGLILPQRGDDHWKCKIPDSEIPKLKELYHAGTSIRSLAISYKVTRQAIRHIICGRRKTADSLPSLPQRTPLRAHDG